MSGSQLFVNMLRSLKRQHSYNEHASKRKQERLLRRLSGTLYSTRLEGNRMNIPHRILTPDDPNKPFSKALTESDSSGDYVTPLSSMADGGSQGSIESIEKHSSLPRMKSYDAVVFDVLRVSPDDFASQITLMDLPVFKSIQPDELTSCAWTNKEKLIKAPNVVAFTRRFNHVNFWVQREILNTHTEKTRAEVLAHFVKIGKKLLELNNLHAVMAVISALQSAAIFRLSKTWIFISLLALTCRLLTIFANSLDPDQDRQKVGPENLSKKEKASYEKMADLFSENNNRQRLRDYMDNVKLPCIPYLGLYLTDLIYIDVAHPHHGGLESQPRRLQMNNILRVIADFQQSTYDNLEVLDHVQNYLKSVRYIEELQKFVEDDNYKLSLKLETPTSNISLSTSREDVSSIAVTPAVELRNPNALTPGPGGSKYNHGHRKSKSLSANFSCPSFLSCTHPQADRTMSLPVKSTAPYLQGVRHLLDDSVLEESPCTSSDGSISGKRSGLEVEEPTESSSSDQESFWPSLNSNLRASQDAGTASFHQTFTCEGCLRRKTILKDGRKPTVASWSRYWMGLWDTNLLYFPAKSLRGTDRNSFKSNPSKILFQFKSNPSKMTSVVGWMVVLGDNPLQPDAFQLTDPVKGNVYKFRAGTQAQALTWCRHLSEASKKFKSQTPPNLITFD